MIHKEKMRYIMKKQILEKNRTKKRLHKIGKKIDEKQKKALKRLKNKPYKMIDLCLCIDDGGMLDIFSFEIGLKNLDRYIFRSIFFITSNCFIYYNKESDFEEYNRQIDS